METIGQMQTFLSNCDQHVGADCDPDLRLDLVLVGAIKRLDAQVLLDPFEEQFDLPALSILSKAMTQSAADLFSFADPLMSQYCGFDLS